MYHPNWDRPGQQGQSGTMPGKLGHMVTLAINNPIYLLLIEDLLSLIYF